MDLIPEENRDKIQQVSIDSDLRRQPFIPSPLSLCTTNYRHNHPNIVKITDVLYGHAPLYHSARTLQNLRRLPSPAIDPPRASQASVLHNSWTHVGMDSGIAFHTGSTMQPVSPLDIGQ